MRIVNSNLPQRSTDWEYFYPSNVFNVLHPQNILFTAKQQCSRYQLKIHRYPVKKGLTVIKSWWEHFGFVYFYFKHIIKMTIDTFIHSLIQKSLYLTELKNDKREREIGRSRSLFILSQQNCKTTTKNTMYQHYQYNYLYQVLSSALINFLS